MGRAGFVIFSALAALAVGTIEYVAYGLYHGSWPDFRELWPFYLLIVVPAPVAAAISALACILDPRFYQRTHWSQTCRVCFLAYIVYAALFASSLFLAPEHSLDGWGEIVFMFGLPLIVAISIIPVLVLEHMIVGMARSRKIGV